MIVHKMHLAKKHFDKILDGSKVIEIRLLDRKRQMIKVGDEIEFSQNENLDKQLKISVINLHIYKSFDDLFSNFPCEYFGANSKQELLDGIKLIYSKEEQEKYGVVGIEMKLN
ncbi:MAG: ASCH domain-containing protein [Candidatus Moraniibacteriota bacterium]